MVPLAKFPIYTDCSMLDSDKAKPANQRNDANNPDKAKGQPSGTSKPKSKSNSLCFLSVLSVPFTAWNELENVIGEFCPDWSHTHRSFIVQHLIRFLELKVLMEEFATKRLLAPTPLLAQAWRALILDKKLHTQVIQDIQDFHGRPHQPLKFTLQKKDLELCRGGNVDRLARTQHLFQWCYGEAMLSSVEDIEAELSVTDTSTITDGLWHLPKCGGDNTSSKHSKKHNRSLPAMSFRAMCLEAVSDLLFADEGSLTPTVVVEDIEDTIEVEPTELDYDSLFTMEFLNTRHVLCRGGSGNNCASPSGLPVFSW